MMTFGDRYDGILPRFSLYRPLFHLSLHFLRLFMLIIASLPHKDGKRCIESRIGVSYVEVFGDTVSDLLKMGARCGHSKVRNVQ